MSTFELTITRTITIQEGWGVDVVPIWAGEDEPEGITDIEVSVVRIDRAACHEVAGAWCVAAADKYWVPVENFKDLEDLQTDDTHDLRGRWFATKREAVEHADTVKARWRNPAPWECFVELG